MRLRLAAVVLVPALALAAPVASRATHTTEPLVVTGSITIGNPATAVTSGVTELLAECSPEDDLNGLDGVWVDLLDFKGHNAVLETDPTLDANVYFYTLACDLVTDDEDDPNYDPNAFSMVSIDLGSGESGIVPANAAFAVIDGFLGTGSFTLTVG